MSILIKGMDMPRNCYECLFGFPTFARSGYTYLCNVKSMPIPKEKYTTPLEVTEAVKEGKRDEDCPLVEIPNPHGKIVDIDKVLSALFNDNGERIVGDVITETTILDTEGEEE